MRVPTQLVYLGSVAMTAGLIVGLAVSGAITMDATNGLAGLWLGHVFTAAGVAARSKDQA